MANVAHHGKPLDTSEKPMSVDSRYYQNSISSDCMACAARTTSRRHRELKLQKNDNYCGPFPSTEDVCHLPKVVDDEIYRKTQLHVITTNKRVKVFGKWTKEKLQAAVMDRLLQRAARLSPQSYEKIPPLRINPISIGVPYDPIIHRGLYSESVLKQLYSSGASESVVIKAMKFGLRHLKPEHLNYFMQFGVSAPALRLRKLWEDLVDESLVTSLRAMGFNDKTSRKITVNGMLDQSELCLMHLMLAGVDVPGILNWQGPPIEVGTRLIKFLRKFGISEDVLQLIVQKGIDEESFEMLKDLGYTETEDEEHLGMHEVVICECDLTILESEISSTDRSTNSSETLVSEMGESKADIKAEESCLCFCSRSISTESSSRSSQLSLVDCNAMQQTKQNSLTDSELLADRNKYLSKTVMIPLAWAMGRALRYKPSDPKYYIACQLLRWRYGDVCKEEIEQTENLVMAWTMEMDRKFMEQRRRDEEKLMAEREAEILRNIPCHKCQEQRRVHRLKERCWKCIKKWVPDFALCELPDACSSCRVDLSKILSSDSSTTTDKSNSRKSEKSISGNTECLTSPSQTCFAKCIESPIDHRDDKSCDESIFKASGVEIM